MDGSKPTQRGPNRDHEYRSVMTSLRACLAASGVLALLCGCVAQSVRETDADGATTVAAGGRPGGQSSGQKRRDIGGVSPPADAPPAFQPAHSLPRASGEYPDFVDVLPADYTGPRFVLSQSYPAQLPSPPLGPWTQIDFRADPEKFLLALRDYCYEGMREVDFRAEQSRVRPWYHIPWMHVGRHPREGVHGMTSELPSPPYKLSPVQTDTVQNWAVGYYNELGGYAIGQVWADPRHPRPELSRFPVGTVVFKLLFTAASAEMVPWTDGALQWQANINKTVDPTSPKVLGTVRLMQMDVAVRDARADGTTGWVFGTLVYDKNAPGASPLDKMRPVGLMWGNDPGITPTMVAAGTVLQETRVLANRPAATASLLGWAGRVDGPVDNPESACLSCHSVAEHPRLSTIFPQGTVQQRLRWFRNLKPNEPFDDGHTALDYSLQEQVALRNYFDPALNPNIGTTAKHDFVQSYVRREGAASAAAMATLQAAPEPERGYLPPSARPKPPPQTLPQ